ncbi:MAG TPA: trypsin-like serine protease [Polyangiaceae bacterium]|nr:trypsin-like serine protease [Polyangiaceae bacterium]
MVTSSPTRRAAGCLALLFVASCGAERGPSGSASNPERSGTARAAILGGIPAPEATGVVSIFNQISIGSCSAALIAPNVVLAARRCVAGALHGCCSDFNEPFDPGDIIVQNGPKFDLGVTRDYRGVSRIVVPEQTEVCGYDLALVILKDPVPATDGTPFEPELGPIAEGTKLVAYGYGPTTPQGPDPGTKRKLENVPVTCGSSCAGVAPSEWTAGTGVCAADGPAVNADGKLVGVASRVSMDCTSAVFESLAAHAIWLRTEVAKAATEAGLSAPAWTSGGGDGAADPAEPTLDPSVCEKPELDSGTNGAGGSSGEVDAGTSATGGKPTESDASPAPTPAAGKSDGGCSMGSGATRPAGGAAVLLGGAWLGALRRRRRR